MDIDSATMELAKSFGGLPPKLRYRFRRFLQKLISNPHQQQVSREQNIQKMAEEMVKMVQEETGAPLAKNEMRCSEYENGCIKLDFGSDVSDDIKKAAIHWAKKRGLSPIEASLAKSVDSPEYVILSKDKSQPNFIVEVVSKHF